MEFGLYNFNDIDKEKLAAMAADNQSNGKKSNFDWNGFLTTAMQTIAAVGKKPDNYTTNYNTYPGGSGGGNMTIVLIIGIVVIGGIFFN